MNSKGESGAKHFNTMLITLVSNRKAEYRGVSLRIAFTHRYPFGLEALHITDAV